MGLKPSYSKSTCTKAKNPTVTILTTKPKTPQVPGKGIAANQPLTKTTAIHNTIKDATQEGKVQNVDKSKETQIRPTNNNNAQNALGAQPDRNMAINGRQIPPRISLPPECGAYVLVLVNVTKLRKDQEEHSTSLKNRTFHWLIANCNFPMAGAREIIHTQRVGWVGPLRKKFEGDCIIIHFKSPQWAQKTLASAPPPSPREFNTTLLSLGYFYRHLISPNANMVNNSVVCYQDPNLGTGIKFPFFHQDQGLTYPKGPAQYHQVSSLANPLHYPDPPIMKQYDHMERSHPMINPNRYLPQNEVSSIYNIPTYNRFEYAFSSLDEQD